MTLKRSGFKKPTLEEVKNKQAAKRLGVKSKTPKAPKVPFSIKKATKVRKQPNKRKGKTERRKLEDDIWELCKKIIRKRHGNTCYTCGARGIEGSNWQTGHGKPKGALPVRYKYDLRNLRPQCMRDNLHYGGMSDIFIAKLEQEKEGLAFLEEACEKTDGTWRIKQGNTMGGSDATLFLKELKEKYKKLL